MPNTFIEKELEGLQKILSTHDGRREKCAEGHKRHRYDKETRLCKWCAYPRGKRRPSLGAPVKEEILSMIKRLKEITKLCR